VKVSDQRLFDLLLEADEEAFLGGEDVKQRSWSAPQRVMSKLGYVSYVLAGVGVPAELSRLHEMQKQLYRPQDTGVGGVHLGTFMFRDVFAKITVPIGFGQVAIDPFKVTDLNEMQCRWLASRGADFGAFLDQFIDLFDFGYGLIELGHTRSVGEDCKSLLGLAHFQLQAAAAIVTGAYDFRGAIQCSLVATELVLKAGLAASGVAESKRRKFGHDLEALAHSLSRQEATMDSARVVATVTSFPDYVDNRYAAEQPGRRETGHIVMGAQYVGAEVMRQFTDRDLRSSITPSLVRSYPHAE